MTRLRHRESKHPLQEVSQASYSPITMSLSTKLKDAAFDGMPEIKCRRRHHRRRRRRRCFFFLLSLSLSLSLSRYFVRLGSGPLGGFESLGSGTIASNFEF